jgi:site-specific DNA-methyltransferase (adenine-specific)
MESEHVMKDLFVNTKSPFYSTKNEMLFLGDTIELLNDMVPESIDMIFADPPYFLSNDGITCQSGRMVSVNKGQAEIKYFKEYNRKEEYLNNEIK